MPDTTTPARAAAVTFENSIRHDLLETGAIIAPTGNILYRRTGQVGQVTFPHIELVAGLGATFAHNHPNGTGPSKEDVEVAIEYGFHELRVVTRDRRFIVHSFSSVQTVAFAAEYQANWPKVERTVVDEIRRGQLNPYDFRGELVHRTLDRTSKALRFRYEREMS